MQHSFSKSLIFNGLLMVLAVGLCYLPIRLLPDIRASGPATVSLEYRPVALAAARSPFRLAGAWELRARDRRFTGISALAIAGDRFLAVSDRGAVVSFDRPSRAAPTAMIADLSEGPGPWGEKWSRDAESLVADPGGRGWWIGYEQDHALLLYEPGFRRVLGRIGLADRGWPPNRGAEGLLAAGKELLVFAESGREVVRLRDGAMDRAELFARDEVADAATAPDGSAWLLLRAKGIAGIRQSLAPLERTDHGLGLGIPIPVPGTMFDNFEGLAIEPRGDGSWRFWLVSDDGHRLMARTLLVALDYDPGRHKKSPAPGAGPLEPRGSGRGRP